MEKPSVKGVPPNVGSHGCRSQVFWVPSKRRGKNARRITGKLIFKRKNCLRRIANKTDGKRSNLKIKREIRIAGLEFEVFMQKGFKNAGDLIKAWHRERDFMKLLVKGTGEKLGCHNKHEMSTR